MEDLKIPGTRVISVAIDVVDIAVGNYRSEVIRVVLSYLLELNY